MTPFSSLKIFNFLACGSEYFFYFISFTVPWQFSDLDVFIVGGDSDPANYCCRRLCSLQLEELGKNRICVFVTAPFTSRKTQNCQVPNYAELRVLCIFFP
jgi:hypothetical protein